MVKITLADGSHVTPDHRELKPNGQQKGYIVLAEEERAKGFVRPYRDTYRHQPPFGCGKDTKISNPIAETYAREPDFYTGTFCVHCKEHRPLEQFDWIVDGDIDGVVGK